MWYLNRARGGALESGALIATLVLLCMLLSVLMYNGDYLGSLIVSWSVALLYNGGERIGGWGLWVGSVSIQREKGFVIHEEREGGKWTGIQWLAEKLIPPTQINWLWHCRFSLFLRGIWWGVCLLPLMYFIEWYYVLASIVWLGVAFPLASEMGYHTSKLFSIHMKYFGMADGWSHQEVWYGLIGWDVVLIGLMYQYLSV